MTESYIKKLNRIKYLIFLIIAIALFSLIWFLSRSFVQITISPITAKLSVDNAPVYLNRSGKAKLTLSPGTHQIKVESENYLSSQEEVTLKKGKRTSLTITLKEKPTVAEVEKGVKFLSPGKNNDEIIYLDPSGKSLIKAKISIENDKEIKLEKTPITSQRLSGIEKIIWSPDKELALFKKADGVYLFDFKKYDFVNQTETLWGKDIGDVAWAPDNSKIAYFYKSNNEQTLIFSNSANTQQTRIANLAEYGIDNPYLAWSPDSQFLIVIPRNKDYSQNKVYLYDTYSGTLKPITDLGNQIEAKFSPDNSKIIYTTYSKGTGDADPFVVSIMDKDGANQKALEMRTSISNLEWLDGSSFIAAEYHRPTGVESFRIERIDNKSSDTVQSAASKLVTRTLVSNDNKVASYETPDGIFAFVAR